MAKFKVEIELDWLNEEDGEINIDDILKDEIVSTVSAQLTMKAFKSAEEKIEEIIQQKVNETQAIVNERFNVLLDDFLNQKRTITDRYGDVKETNISVIDMLKTACDNFINEKVDEDGKSISESYYKEGKSRIQYIIDKNINSTMRSEIEGAVRDVKNGLTKQVKEEVTKQMGKNLADIVGLDNLLK